MVSLVAMFLQLFGRCISLVCSYSSIEIEVDKFEFFCYNDRKTSINL